ncbi:MAG: T9SS type A sorting domain-containing protein, partial [Pseudomonadota bacterium]
SFQYSENLISIEIHSIYSYRKNTEVIIYNLLGKSVFFQTFDYTNIKVNINNLLKGMYIVYIQNADIIYSKKIIK